MLNFIVRIRALGEAVYGKIFNNPFFHSRKKGLFLSKKIERRRNAVHTKNRSFFDMHLLYAVFMKKSMVFS